MLSVGLGVLGYVLMAVVGFLEVGGGGSQQLVPGLHGLCAMLLWYGLYFGVLGRDCAEVAADRMVCDAAPHTLLSLSKWSCAIPCVC